MTSIFRHEKKVDAYNIELGQEAQREQTRSSAEALLKTFGIKGLVDLESEGVLAFYSTEDFNKQVVDKNFENLGVNFKSEALDLSVAEVNKLAARPGEGWYYLVPKNILQGIEPARIEQEQNTKTKIEQPENVIQESEPAEVIRAEINKASLKIEDKPQDIQDINERIAEIQAGPSSKPQVPREVTTPTQKLIASLKSKDSPAALEDIYHSQLNQAA